MSDPTHEVRLTATESVVIRGLLRDALAASQREGVYVNAGVRKRSLAFQRDLIEKLTRAYVGDN